MSHDDERPATGFSRWQPPTGAGARADDAQTHDAQTHDAWAGQVDEDDVDAHDVPEAGAGSNTRRLRRFVPSEPSARTDAPAAAEPGAASGPDPEATHEWSPNFDNTGGYDVPEPPRARDGRASAFGAPTDKAAPALHRPMQFEDVDEFGRPGDSQATTAMPAYVASTDLTHAAAAAEQSSRPPLVVWLLTGTFAALMLMCTFLYPALSGPGESQHTDLAYSFANGNRFYDPGERYVSAGVQGAQQSSFPPGIPLADARVLPRGARPSFDELGGDRAGSLRVVNATTQHPPLYYGIGAGVLRILPDSWAADRQVAILRYVSVLFMLALPLLAWATVTALVGNKPAATIAAAIPLAIPGLTRVGASVTNESLIVLLGAVLLWLLAKVLAGNLRAGTGVAVGVVAGLACLTQAIGLAFPVVVVVAYVVSWIRQRRTAWLPLVLAGVLTALISGWWWIRNVALFHTILPRGLGDHFAAVRGPARGNYDLQTYTHDFFAVTGWRVLGGIGMPEGPRFSLVFSWIWLGVLGAGIILAVGFGVGGRLGRGVAAAFVLPPVLVLVALWVAGRSDFLFNGYLPLAQGRYLYPVLTGIAALTGIGLARLVGDRAAHWLPLAAVLGALATQAWAWRQLLHAWWTPHVAGSKDEIRETVRAILRWSPWAQPVATATFIAVAALGTLTLLAAIGYGAHRSFDEDYPMPRR